MRGYFQVDIESDKQNIGKFLMFYESVALL